MALSIVIRSGGTASPPRITFDAPRVVIGRGDGCEVRLPDPSVSHRHASIRQRGTDWVVLDEGSSNGTFVGAQRLVPQTPRALRSGDLVRVGRVWLEVQIEQAMPTQNAQLATKEIALALVAEALSAEGESPALRVAVAEGPDAGRELRLTEMGRRYVAGRGAGVDLALDDDDASRRHVELFRRGTELCVRDLGSKNGSRLGEQPLVAERETPWPPGMPLWIGKNRLSYSDPVLRALGELEHAADEHIPDGESVDPPSAEAAATPTPSESVDAAFDGLAQRRAAAPIGQVPRKGTRPTAPRTGWNGTDLLVALLAVVVLGVSLTAIYWLMRAM